MNKTISIFFVVLMFVACSRRPPESSDGVSERQSGPKTPPVSEATAPPEAETHAADQLINDGVAKLEASDYNMALSYFEEAVRLEPSYGVPYYWLAQTKLKAGDATRASHFLNKATQLLGNDPSWEEKLSELKTKINGAKKF